MDIADRLDVHRPQLSASEAGVILEQYLRNNSHPPGWTIERIIDGDAKMNWHVNGRHSYFKPAHDTEHLRGCWVINVNTQGDTIWIMNKVKPSYLVDKWSGSVMPTVRTEVKYVGEPRL